MIVLSYGFKQPENGDRGSIWFPALNDNIQRLNDHTHDGTNSAPLAASAISASTVSIPSGSWVSAGTGIYRQDVTCPAGFTFDGSIINFKLSTGEIIYPSVSKLTATTFRIFTMNNALTYSAVFK